MKSSSRKISHAQNHVQEDADELIANISKLMAEAEEMLSESTSHHAEEKIELLRSHRNGNDHGFMEKYVSAKTKISAALRKTDETIRACPYESLAIALGLGVVLGAVLSRRSGD